HRPPLLAYPTHQQQASLERQPGITVGHEDLRDLVVTLRQATPHPEVLLTSTNHRECHQRPGRVQLAVDWDDGAPSLAEEVSGTYVVYQVVEGTDVPLTEPLPLGQSTTPGPTAAQIDTDDAGRIDTFAIVVDLEFEGMADRFCAGSEMRTA